MRAIAKWLALVVCACDSGDLPPPPPPLVLPVTPPVVVVDPPRPPPTIVDTFNATPPQRPGPMLRVAIDDATTTGNLDAANATRVIKSRTGLWRACYQKERNHVSALPLGTLVINARIDANGAPLDISTSGFANASFVSCVTANFVRLRFPQNAPGTVRDSFTYSFADPYKQN